jgi:predicted AAA+ superfamily ATPase
MYIKRELEGSITNALKNQSVLMILGSRYVGKTTLIKNIKKNLKKKGFDARIINLENLKYLMKIEKNFENLINFIGPLKKKKVYVFLEEIHNLSEPIKLIKHINERYSEQIKLIVTASFNKFENINKDLQNKVDVFSLGVLNFREFLDFKKKHELLKLFTEGSKGRIIVRKDIRDEVKTELKYLLDEYSRYGGYPDVVLGETEEDKIEVLEDIYNTFLLKDVEKKRIHNKPKLYSMIRNLAENVGNPLNQNGIAKNLSLSITAVENYLTIVEKAFFVKKVRPFAVSFNKEIKKMPKLYFLDNGIRNLILDNFNTLEERMDKSGFFENIAFNFLHENMAVKEVNYWRTQTKHEVDFILNKKIAIEVEFNANMYKKSKFKQFFKNYQNIPLHIASYINLKEDNYSIYDLI